VGAEPVKGAAERDSGEPLPALVVCRIRREQISARGAKEGDFAARTEIHSLSATSVIGSS